MNFGYCKVSAVSPVVSVGNPKKNAAAAMKAIEKASADGIQILVFPELFLTGASCGDLFYQERLLTACEDALGEICAFTKENSMIVVMGLPVPAAGKLYHCAAVLQNGKLLGITPKSYLANYGEAQESRWFVSGMNCPFDSVTLCGQAVPFGSMLYQFGELTLGVEICEDMWVPVSPGAILALSGANVIANLAASSQYPGKTASRTRLITQHSATNLCGYIYASAGAGESTTDTVCSGSCVIAEAGEVLADGGQFNRMGNVATATLDLQKLNAARRQTSSFHENAAHFGKKLPTVTGTLPLLPPEQVSRQYSDYPFLPSPKEAAAFAAETLSIQAAGLAKRMEAARQTRAILGISGGLDSTLALLVAVEAMKLLGLPSENILCITMPGFGTTGATYQNALDLIRYTDATAREISIKNACLSHFADIGHDPAVLDVTYENAQARERTQILMDVANKENGILVGTGDLSEIALGWCTYNGDHMSMYSVNGSIPKTLIRSIVAEVAALSSKELGEVLRKILDTPVSPELLPPDENGDILQKTEEQIGPYELHDFFLYHFILSGFSPEKLLFAAKRAFGGRFSEDILKGWLKLFLRRFFISQFKRSCMPDGPKASIISLSPRNGLIMPSDADMDGFLLQPETGKGNLQC